MRDILRLGFIVTAFLALTGGPAGAQDDSTYRVILYLAEGRAPAEITLTRLQEVWAEGEGESRLRQLLNTSQIQRLEDVTVLPGRDTPGLQLGNVTVRVRGLYKEPRHDAIFLRIEVDGGPETLVKEIISRFNETIVLAYPLAEGNRTVVALLVPARMGN